MHAAEFMKDYNESYVRRIEAQISRAMKAGHVRYFADLLPLLRGAPPDLVWAITSQKNLPLLPPPKSTIEPTCEALKYEPHPLDSDWAFTKETAAQLARQASTKANSIACFGTPRVHQALQELGQDSVLFDQNPIFSDMEHFVQIDLCDTYPPRQLDFDAVVIDAPWYPEILMTWLHQAWLASKPTAKILLSLWPELTRPSASDERDEIIETLSIYGEVEQHINRIAYTLPLFEEASLQAAHIPLDKMWRHGDLIVINKTTDRVPPRPLLSASASWMRYTIDHQQLAIRAAPQPHSSKHLITTVPSVSRRFVGRRSINVWTSKNIGGNVEEIDQLIKALDNVAKNGPITLLDEFRHTLAALGITLSQKSVITVWRQTEWTTQK